MNNIRSDLFNTKDEVKIDPGNVERLINSCEEQLTTQEIFFWLSTFSQLNSTLPEYKVEEMDDYYIDNNRQYSFTYDDFKKIGKKLLKTH